MSDDYGTEAEALEEWSDEGYDDLDLDLDLDNDDLHERPSVSHYRGGDKPQPDRWRCLMTGCNPVLNETTAREHKSATGHRVAKWPVRSVEGKRRARQRNRTGYYDKYNVGEKATGKRESK